MATLSYTTFIAYISLIRLQNLPDLNISFADKIFHFGAYAVLTTLWFYTFFLSFKKKFKISIIYAAILSIAFGIIIEVLQDMMTSYRALDVYDAISNTLGALLASAAIWITKSLHVKNI